MTQPSEFPGFPPDFFERLDEADDEQFYGQARLVTHLDDATLEALTQLYRELVPAHAHVLDLMSSWVSHLPPEVPYQRVSGLGLNRQELASNPRLHDFEVHNLNREPELPYGDAEFDAVLNAVSVQYLTRPVEVFASVRRVLRPRGLHAVAISHRLFPEKAVAIWQAMSMEDRVRLVGSYFFAAGGWDEPVVIDRSPEGADPLLVIVARRVE
jgi:SAM-dependent methyltransferase